MAILIALLALCLATSSGAQPISAESAQYHDLDAGELVAEGNVEVLSHLVALKEVDPNRRTRTGSTLLCVAVEQGNSEIAALLLQAGAKVETRDKTGHTPLCIAALAKNTEMVKLLLSYGASREHVSGEGTPSAEEEFSAREGQLENSSQQVLDTWGVRPSHRPQL